MATNNEESLNPAEGITYNWDDTSPLLSYNFIMIKGDSGTGVSFLGKKLAGKGYRIFNENLLLSGTSESPTLFRELSECITEGQKTVYIGNKFNTRPELTELIKPGLTVATISFALHPEISIPVKEYIFLNQ